MWTGLVTIINDLNHIHNIWLNQLDPVLELTSCTSCNVWGNFVPTSSKITSNNSCRVKVWYYFVSPSFTQMTMNIKWTDLGKVWSRQSNISACTTARASFYICSASTNRILCTCNPYRPLTDFFTADDSTPVHIISQDPLTTTGT